MTLSSDKVSELKQIIHDYLSQVFRRGTCKMRGGGSLPNRYSALSLAHVCACVTGLQHGVKTLQTQDTSDPRHFGTIRLVPKCPDSSAPVPKCLSDISALVPNCLDLDHTFLVYVNFCIY